MLFAAASEATTSARWTESCRESPRYSRHGNQAGVSPPGDAVKNAAINAFTLAATSAVPTSSDPIQNRRGIGADHGSDGGFKNCLSTKLFKPLLRQLPSPRGARVASLASSSVMTTMPTTLVARQGEAVAERQLRGGRDEILRHPDKNFLQRFETALSYSPESARGRGARGATVSVARRRKPVASWSMPTSGPAHTASVLVPGAIAAFASSWACSSILRIMLDENSRKLLR